MSIIFRTASGAVFLILTCFAALGQPLSSPRTSQGFHSGLSLLEGGREGDHWLAGIEITLDPGFKTYWRNPGESGLPPRFDWSGSDNAAFIDVLWPAPSRHEDAAGVAYTYSDKVVLPVRVRAKDPSKPVTLALSADYGICKDICIPAHAEVRTVPSDGASGRTAIDKALAKVPLSQPIGVAAELAVVAIEPLLQDKPALKVTVRAPSGAQPTLFAEGPEDWYVSTSPPGSGNTFTVVVEEKPKNASGPIPLKLTLVSGEKAIETDVSLDGSKPPR
jgi:DsbC/DsbD-like thiol-disulfide interchange protein